MTDRNLAPTIEALKRAIDDANYRDVDMDDLDGACQKRDDAALLEALANALGDVTSGEWWIEQTGGEANYADLVRNRLERK